MHGVHVARGHGLVKQLRLLAHAALCATALGTTACHQLLHVMRGLAATGQDDGASRAGPHPLWQAIDATGDPRARPRAPSCTFHHTPLSGGVVRWVAKVRHPMRHPMRGATSARWTLRWPTVLPRPVCTRAHDGRLVQGHARRITFEWPWISALCCPAEWRCRMRHLTIPQRRCIQPSCHLPALLLPASPNHGMATRPWRGAARAGHTFWRGCSHWSYVTAAAEREPCPSHVNDADGGMGVAQRAE